MINKGKKERTFGDNIDSFVVAFTGEGFKCEESSETDGQGRVSGTI
jgi:hypothetical protein